MAKRSPDYKLTRDKLLRANRPLNEIQSLLLKDFGVHQTIKELTAAYHRVNNINPLQNFERKILIEATMARQIMKSLDEITPPPSISDVKKSILREHSISVNENYLITLINQSERHILYKEYVLKIDKDKTSDLNKGNKNNQLQDIVHRISEEAIRLSHPQSNLLAKNIIDYLNKMNPDIHGTR
jgi:hypothetical protein